MRYHQLEHLLLAGKLLRKMAPSEKSFRSILPFVVIDSLNMFAPRPLGREELFRLFDLFRQHQTTGMFLVESSQETPFDSTLADVVISLHVVNDNGYLVKQIEVEKSRYRNQVYGRHPFKTVGASEGETPPIGGHLNGRKNAPRHGVVVYPSLHYVVLRAGEDGKSSEPKVTWQDPGTRWGIDAFTQILPANLKPGSVIAVEGPRGTFKTNLAMTFLAKGLSIGESGLLIRLHDEQLLHKAIDRCQWPALSEDVVKTAVTTGQGTSGSATWWTQLQRLPHEELAKWQLLAKQEKAQICVWSYPNGEEAAPQLFEIDFKSGNLLAEEFIQTVWDVMIRLPKDKKIRRVVLDDVSEIGTAYPFLRRSSTSGEIFLPAVTHVMRNNGVDLVVTGTTGELVETDAAVSRICSVADAVVSCRFVDVFGKRYVTIHGEGLIAQQETADRGVATSVPPVVQNEQASDHSRMFRVNATYLEGLVGFETGNIHRPGVSLHLFEQNDRVHGRYNRELERMLCAAFASESGRTRSGESAGRPTTPEHESALPSSRSDIRSRVIILPFESRDSEAMHDSLEVFQEQEPLDRTVLCTVDEFWLTSQWTNRFMPFERPKGFDGSEELLVRPNREFQRAKPRIWPYYMNLQVLAYRRDMVSDMARSVKSWEQVLEASRQVELNDDGRARKSQHMPIRRRFWFDLFASETLCCALLDALSAGYNQATNREDVPLEEVVRNRTPNSHLTVQEQAEIVSLYQLLQMTQLDELSGEERAEYRKVLPPDSAFYLCWYSQLRELIDRAPGLADKLDVCALPGKGFVGDWFIGIVEGSVSPALGKTVIHKLCRQEEEYKRFSKGVGLPVRASFRNKDYYAWPRGGHVLLDKVLDFHQAANSRTDITDYPKIRSILSTIATQLSPLAGPSFRGNEVERTVVETVERLFKQIPPLQGVPPR